MEARLTADENHEFENSCDYLRCAGLCSRRLVDVRREPYRFASGCQEGNSFSGAVGRLGPPNDSKVSRWARAAARFLVRIASPLTPQPLADDEFY